MQFEAALAARGWDATRARVRTAVPASDETAASDFVPLPAVDGEAAFTALPPPPELAGNGKDADGDVLMEPPTIDNESDDEGAAAKEEETREERWRRLQREAKKRRRKEQTAPANAAAQKDLAGEDLTPGARARGARGAAGRDRAGCGT